MLLIRDFEDSILDFLASSLNLHLSPFSLHVLELSNLLLVTCIITLYLFQTNPIKPPFPGATALVTGAGTGLGLEVCLVLASGGWQVICAVANEEQKKEVNSANKHLFVVVMDVASQEGVQAGFLAIPVQRRESLCVVVNNAAMSVADPLEMVDCDSVLAQVLNVNAIGCLRVCQASLPWLRKNAQSRFRPVILNISSGSW